MALSTPHPLWLLYSLVLSAQPSPRALAYASLALAAMGLTYLLAIAYVVQKTCIENARHLFLLLLVFFTAGNALAVLSGRCGCAGLYRCGWACR